MQVFFSLFIYPLHPSVLGARCRAGLFEMGSFWSAGVIPTLPLLLRLLLLPPLLLLLLLVPRGCVATSSKDNNAEFGSVLRLES